MRVERIFYEISAFSRIARVGFSWRTAEEYCNNLPVGVVQWFNQNARQGNDLHFLKGS
jgi:hypothetical protein